MRWLDMKPPPPVDAENDEIMEDAEEDEDAD
jgi:hypothetical protein